MNSKRLLAIASYIDKEDNIIDVGCDHGYLGIYLKKNNLCSSILLTDLRESALNNAIVNIEKYNLNIDTFKTDGLNNINLDLYNTITISGMGTKTILDITRILKTNKTINKLIIQSNNDLDILRKEISKIGFKLEDEVTIKENDIFYIICKFTKGSKKLTSEEINFGLVKKDKKEYYQYLLNRDKEILSNIPNTNINARKKIENKLLVLEKLLKECG